MSSRRRATQPRHPSSTGRLSAQNGQNDSFNGSHPALDDARDLLSQALEEVDTHTLILDRLSQTTANALANQASSALNTLASGAALVAELDEESPGNVVTIKSEPDVDSDADSPVPKNKKFKYRSIRRSKKRKQVDEPSTPPPPPPPNLYSLKLFDRTVDLSKFDDHSPLYSLCRAWVRNPSLKSGEDDSEEGATIEHSIDATNVDEIDEDNAIHRLPDPLPASRDLRLPENPIKPSSTAEQIDFAINSRTEEDVQTLLEQNRQRWKGVRRDWIKSASENEARYKDSLDLIKSMYEKTIATQNSVIEI